VIASAWLARNDIVRYTQVSTYSHPARCLFVEQKIKTVPTAPHTGSTRELASGLLKQVRWAMSQYDEHLAIVVRTMVDLTKALSDPEYQEKVDPGEEKFSGSVQECGDSGIGGSLRGGRKGREYW